MIDSSMLFEKGSTITGISPDELKTILHNTLAQLGTPRRILLLPPDHTRFHSMAGPITNIIYHYFDHAEITILPALGTHAPMNSDQLRMMFGDIPLDRFAVHNWRTDCVTLGEVPGSFIQKVSDGALNYSWPVQVNRLLTEGNFDCILSIGQVVPHEVVGMANHAKNIFVGTGGAEGINKSHFLGAVYGMERIMGRADNPVRSVLHYAAEQYAQKLPIHYILTIIGRNDNGSLPLRGLYIGQGRTCFDRAAALSKAVNIAMLDRPVKKAVVYLDEQEYTSTWLGNKAIYRTRMALADNAHLIILAPGVREFGEDRTIDSLIRTYGYCGTPRILDLIKTDDRLRANLSAAAHLIHGSTEGRFSVTYCPGGLSKDEIMRAGFLYGRFETMAQRYDPSILKHGFNTLDDGEEIFFIANPALGLWANKERFEKNS